MDATIVAKGKVLERVWIRFVMHWHGLGWIESGLVQKSTAWAFKKVLSTKSKSGEGQR
jgi:hypothetical protein